MVHDMDVQLDDKEIEKNDNDAAVNYALRRNTNG